MENLWKEGKMPIKLSPGPLLSLSYSKVRDKFVKRNKHKPSWENQFKFERILHAFQTFPIQNTNPPCNYYRCEQSDEMY